VRLYFAWRDERAGTSLANDRFPAQLEIELWAENEFGERRIREIRTYVPDPSAHYPTGGEFRR